LCNGDTNQREDKDNTVIFPKVHELANTLVPVVLIVHLVVQWLIGTTPSPHIGCRKNPTDQVRVA
jgi:hypothetical protein